MSSSVTAWRETPSSMPACGMPARSTALNAKVAIRPPSPCSPASGPASTSLRSSSGFEERVSAIAIVIWPARTRPASDVSIVCMPCAPPVWMSE